MRKTARFILRVSLDLKRVDQSPCFHQFLMKGCSDQDGDLEWSDSFTWLLPANPWNKFSPHLFQKKGYQSRKLFFLSVFQPKHTQVPAPLLPAATILSSSTFYCCRLYHLHCSFAVLISKRQGLAGSNQVQLSDHLRSPSWSEQPFIRNW